MNHRRRREKEEPCAILRAEEIAVNVQRAEDGRHDSARKKRTFYLAKVKSPPPKERKCSFADDFDPVSENGPWSGSSARERAAPNGRCIVVTQREESPVNNGYFAWEKNP